jgi:hypothetical protein
MENQRQQVPGETFQDYLREYQALGDEFQEAMSLQDFFTIKYRNSVDTERGVNQYQVQFKTFFNLYLNHSTISNEK